MFFIYWAILAVNAAVLVFRHEFYLRKGVDPLFACSLCPIYQRYSSPNAPQLSAVLDPNNVHLFNHSVSPLALSPAKRETCTATNLNIGRGLAVVDEEALCDELAKSEHRSDDDSGHISLLDEPERAALPESDDDSASNGDEQRVDGGAAKENEVQHMQSVSTVLKDSLFPMRQHLRQVSMM